MQIRRLRLVNFRQHADTSIDLEAGLTGIIGPNGSGKTTLLEAIAWAMYGTQAARGTRDSIRRRSAPPRSRVEVELDFTLGVHRYRIARSLQNATLYQDGEPAPIANSAAAVTDKVTRLLGMTRDEFFNTYFTGQKELAIMAAMSAPDRARFLSRVLGYERLAAVQTKLKDERTAVKASLQTAELGLADPAAIDQEESAAQERLTGATATLAAAAAHQAAAEAVVGSLQPRWEELQRRREEVQTIETDLNIAEHSAVEARRTFEALDLELTESLAAKTKRDELLPAVADWEPLIVVRDRLDAAALAFAGRRALEARVAEVRKNVAAQDERLGELPDEARLATIREELAVAQELAQRAVHGHDEQRTEWVREKQDAETSRKALLEQHEELKLQRDLLAEAGPTGICPTCGKPLGKEHQAVLEDLEVRLADIMVQGRHYRARIDQLSREPERVVAARLLVEQAEAEATRLTTAVGRLEVGVKDRVRSELARAELTERLGRLEAQLAATPTSYDEAEHKRVRERLTALEPLRDQLVRLTTRAERAAELVPRAAEAEQELTRVETRATTLREQLSVLGWSPEVYDETRMAYQAAERDRQAAQVAVVRAEAERNAAIEHQAAVVRRRDEHRRRVKEVERLRGEQIFNQELDRAFSDLRTELNSTIRPDLADTASALLGELTNGRYSDLELDEDYRPTVFDDGEPSPVISGGEEDVANLALRLAISQMIADRAGQPFSLLILDEIFGSLDEERRSAVMDLLRGLADRFPQVILITHIESVRDGFDRIIRIDYDVEAAVASAREERLDRPADGERAGFGDEAPHVAA
jgi:exonuclease SbcC